MRGGEKNMDFLTMLIVGLIAGWLASMLMRGRGLGILGDIVVGVIGALIGGYLLGLMGIFSSTILGTIVAAVIGAVVLLFFVGLVKRESQPGMRGSI